MTATAFIVAGGILAGAVLRRIFGGWLGWSRSVCAALLITFTVAPAWWAWGSFENWHLPFGLDLPMWARALVVTVIAWVHWVDGHDFSRPWKLLYRYGIGGVLVALVAWRWYPLLIGPLVAASDWACKRWGGAIRLPWDTSTQQMIDGWEGEWEMTLGAVTVGSFWAAALL